MSDQKCCVTVFGVVVGVALIGIAVGLLAKSRQSQTAEDVNDVIAHAKNTINSLNEAVETIKSSAVHN